MDSDPGILTRRRRVFLSPKLRAGEVDVLAGEDVQLRQDELEACPSGRWIFYKTIQMQTPEGKGRGYDVTYVHGYSAYGGLLTYECLAAIRAGFRVHLLDLPGHGRSSGPAAFIPHPWHLPEAVHAIMSDVYSTDKSEGRLERKTFLTGHSLGGLTVLLSSLPGSLDIGRSGTRFQDRNLFPFDRILGVYALCPLIAIVGPPPSPSVLSAGRIIARLCGKATLLTPAGGDTISDDPDVFKAFVNDPMVYTGKMSLGSALAFFTGFTALRAKAGDFNFPLRIAHGDHDRTTSHLASIDFIQQCGSTDKSVRIFEGYEHTLVKVVEGQVKARDIARNKAVLDDWLEWMLLRVPEGRTGTSLTSP